MVCLVRIFGLGLFVILLFFLAWGPTTSSAAGRSRVACLGVRASGLVFAAAFLLQGSSRPLSSAWMSGDRMSKGEGAVSDRLEIDRRDGLQPLAAFAAAAAVLILRFRRLPRWLALFAVLLFLGGLARRITVPVLALFARRGPSRVTSASWRRSWGRPGERGHRPSCSSSGPPARSSRRKCRAALVYPGRNRSATA